MQKIMARMRVSRVLKHAVPAAADVSYSPGDQIFVWRENGVKNRIGDCWEWMLRSLFTFRMPRFETLVP